MTTYTQKELIDMGYTIQNEMIESIDLVIDAHFNNAVSLAILCKNCVLCDGRVNTGNVGFMLKNLVALLNIQDERLWLSDINDIPIRIAIDKSWKVIAFGNFMSDRFIMIDDFVWVTD